MQLTNDTLVDVLQTQAHQRGSKVAFTFVSDDDSKDLNVDFLELDRSVRGIAAELQERGASGERVLLLFPPGIDFVKALFACFYAGAIAVPSYPPAPSKRDRSSGNRLSSIIHDASPSFILTTDALKARVDSLYSGLGVDLIPTCLSIDEIAEDAASAWTRPNIHSDQSALLQYTSGTTGSPKGVLITHANLLDNLEAIHRALEINEYDTGVNWLPPYHDMGLIGGLLQPIYEGSHVTLLSPVAFLQKPFRWLEAISRTRGTVSGGPNFAYDLCLKRVTQEQKDLLDLSCWRVALNGAEPINPSTLQDFSTAFVSCGFSSKAWSPCYGMAETTLFVCGGPVGDRPPYSRFDRSSLERNQAVLVDASNPAGRDLVSSGVPQADISVRIVNPETLAETPEGGIGEIWVSSNSVGEGYWNDTELTKYTFQASLPDNDEKQFLRTGDLGFLYEGELFVTGRVKDLIVLNGRSIYPQHLESTVELSLPSLRKTASAAFVLESEESPLLIIVSEVEREALSRFDSESAATAILDSLKREHNVQPASIVFIKTATLPKTSSGKTQRHACCDLYLSGRLDTVAV